MITRSPTAGATLTAAGVRADVAVVANGVDSMARHRAPEPRDDDIIVRTDQQRMAAALQGPELALLHDRDVLASQTEDIYRAAVARGS